MKKSAFTLIEVLVVVAIIAILASLLLPVVRKTSKPTQPAPPPVEATNTPVTPTEPAKNAVYPVWFGTNRKPNAEGNGFTAERNETNTYGRVDVYVPEAHRFGETGNGFWTRLLRRDLRDDNLRVQYLEQQDEDQFFSEINAAIEAARETGNQPQALVYLHGFNVTFEDAAIRAAQIGYDLKVPGPVAFFSWPSRGKVEDYTVDEATIEASEGAITEFLIEFAAKCGTTNINIIAHSMGNRGLLRALQRISANAEMRSKVKFNQIILAAPDIDRGLFLNLASLYPQFSTRTTLYESDGDLPVYLSSRIHDAPRAGYFKPYTSASGIDAVAVPNFDVDLLGHSYYAQADALLYDIHDLLLHDSAPPLRQRVGNKPITMIDGNPVWELNR